MQIALDKIEVGVSESLFRQVYVEFNGKTISVNDRKARVIEILQDNYKRIKAHYFLNLSKHQLSDIDITDLNIICVKILIYYLDQYSRWKEQYKKSNYDIRFYENDFEHPSTYDIIIFFLKEKYLTTGGALVKNIRISRQKNLIYIGQIGKLTLISSI